MRYTATILLASSFLVSHALGQLGSIERIQEIQRGLDRGLENIHALEDEYGRLDRRMLESLDQFSVTLITNERFTEAHDILDQAIQIVRVSEGLYSPTQFPLLVRRIENYVNRGDWDSAKETMEHLDWLLKRGENTINESLIAALLDLIDIHLWGVADDLLANQSYHFRRAERLTDLASRVALFNYEAGDGRVPGIMYKKVVQLYLQSVAVEAGGATGIALRNYSNTGYAISRRDARNGLYYGGLRTLVGIRDFYLKPTTLDLEGAGLAYFYIGDWEILFGNRGAAEQAYKEGYNLLLEVGYSDEFINQYTVRPQILPLAEFHGSLEDALNATLNSSLMFGVEDNKVNFTFKQWSKKFSRTITPVNYGAKETGLEDIDYAKFSFNLFGLDQIGRWYRSRYKNNVSSPQNLELISRKIGSDIDWFELTESIKDFHFRPKFINGNPQPVTATLHYQLANQ